MKQEWEVGKNPYKLLDGEKGLEHRSHIVPTAKAVAEHFGRTIRTIRNWSGRGMPQLLDGYDLRAIEDWALKQGSIKERKIEANQGNDRLDRAYYELEIKRLDSELKAIKLQKETGVLILREDVERGWVDRAFELKRDLLSMARRLSLRGSNKEAPALYEIIRLDCIEVLKKYSRGHVDVDTLEVPENGELDG